MAITHPTHPAPITEGRCNALLWNCKGFDEEGNECDYHYTNEKETHCPLCNTPRRRCNNFVTKGRTACRFHGGNTPMGIDHPFYKGKGFSKNLPTKMFEYFTTALHEPDEILNLTQDIALLEARQTELITRINEQEYGVGAWKIFLDKFIKIEKIVNQLKEEELSERYRIKLEKSLFDLLEETIKIAYDQRFLDEKLWEELQKTQDQKAKLIKLETSRREKAAEVITPDQFKTLLGYIINSVSARVQDPQTRMNILADIQKLN